MTLRELKTSLNGLEELHFLLPDGQEVPRHFHLTEAGRVTKDFIDCGGTIRNQKTLVLQLWVSVDIDHRLSSEKFLQILDIYENNFGNANIDVEVEYERDTVHKYALEFQEGKFYMVNTKTDCLAKENCNIPVVQTLVDTKGQQINTGCKPGGNCC